MFKNRKWIGTVLLTLVAIVILAAVAGGIYKVGYAKGAKASQVEGFAIGGHLGLREFDHPGAGLRGGGSTFPGRGKGPERLGESQGHDEGFVRGFGEGGFGRGGLSRHRFGSVLPRLLFAGAMIGLLIFVVVKMFRPEGWQLNIGPLHAVDSGDVEEEKPAAKAKKASSKKGK